MAEREIRLRYTGLCVACSTPQEPGTLATWDDGARTIRCGPCSVAADRPRPTTAVSGSDNRPLSQTTSPVAKVDLGAAGRSADEMARRIKEQDEARLRTRFGRFGGLISALTDEPAAARNYAKGAKGERRVGNRLDELAPLGVITLHDRRVPTSRANIDHIAVSSSGIYVVDAKKYSGKLERRDVGGWFRTDERLFVGGRDRTGLVGGVAGQADVVLRARGPEFDGVPVVPVLCFVDVEVGFLQRPFQVRGVHVTWGKELKKMVSRPGPIDDETLQAVVQRLGTRLPPA